MGAFTPAACSRTFADAPISITSFGPGLHAHNPQADGSRTGINRHRWRGLASPPPRAFPRIVLPLRHQSLVHTTTVYTRQSYTSKGILKF